MEDLTINAMREHARELLATLKNDYHAIDEGGRFAAAIESSGEAGLANLTRQLQRYLLRSQEVRTLEATRCPR